MRNSSVASSTSPSINVFIFGRQSRSVELITLILSVLTIAVGLVGNLLLTLTIATSASLRTPMNTFVLSIGLVDLLTSAFLLPLRAIVEWQLLSHKEIDPTVYGIELFVRTFTDTTRLFLMMSLSVERYQSIANPLSVSKDQAKRRAMVMSGMTWTVSIVLSGISIRYFCDTVLHQPCLDNTDVTTTNWGDLEVFVEMPLTILSILVIAVCYSLIVVILRQQRRKMAGHLKPKINQVVPVDSGKMSQLQAQNGSKAEILEIEEKTAKIQLSSSQEVHQDDVKPESNGECNVNDSKGMINNDSCPKTIKTNNVAEKGIHDFKLSSSIKSSDKLKPGVIKTDNIDISEKQFNREIKSNNCDSKACHENADKISNRSHHSTGEEDRKMLTSSRSPLIIASREIVTEHINCLCEDAEANLENQLAKVINMSTANTTAQSTATGRHSHGRRSFRSTQQSVSGKAYTLPGAVVTESTIVETQNNDEPDHTYTQGLNVVHLHLTSNSGDTSRIQPSHSIHPSQKHQDIQISVGRGTQAQAAQSRATSNIFKASPRLQNRKYPRLQSVIAFLHTSDGRHKNKMSTNSMLPSSYDTAVDSNVIPGSENSNPNLSHVPSFSKPQNPQIDQNTLLTSDNNPTAPSVKVFNSHSQSSLSDCTQETSSRNTTLQTSMESDLDNAHELLLQISNKDSGSVALSCEPTSEYRCSDDMSTYNNSLSISEIQVADSQQKTPQLTTNCPSLLSQQQHTEHIETKGHISMPENSMLDSTSQNIPNSLKSNPKTNPEDQKTVLHYKSNDREQDKGTSFPAIDNTKHIEVVEMDGTVHLQIVNSQNASPIEGAVCLMNPRNREQGKRRVELKAALKVGLIVCCFACLWMPLPLSVCILRGTSCWTDSMKIDMLAVFSSLAASTAAIDPILYGLLNPQIRSALQANVYKIRRKITNYLAT